MPVHASLFSCYRDTNVMEYTLDNGNGMAVQVIDFGGIITRLYVPGRGGSKDVVLGFDSLDSYLQDQAYIGAVVGRVANRIAGGRITLDGIPYHLDVNEGGVNHLHGGFRGFNRMSWKSEAYTKKQTPYLRLHRVSRHGEAGYPGNLEVTLTYWLNTENILGFEVDAITDQPTLVNIAQHSYFNLQGHDHGDISDHFLMINAGAITPTGPDLIPSGALESVAGTAYDFRELTRIGEKRGALGRGFDSNFVLREAQGVLRTVAKLKEPVSGRVMTLSTTKPGLQFYDGSKLAAQSLPGKGGTPYPACGGLCLEPQFFPDGVNQQAFASPILRPGELYHHLTTYAFDIE